MSNDFALSAKSSRTFRIGDFEPVGGHSFVARLLDHIPPGDSIDEPFGSGLDLLEDGRGLGPAHALHSDIVEKGYGRFSHWREVLYFSTSDNSDPRCNGRRYEVYLPKSNAHSVSAAIEALKSLAPSATPSAAYTVVERIMGLVCPSAKLGEDLKSFWGDAEFIDVYRTVCGNNYRSLERKYAAVQLLNSLDWMDGDTAECGVYNGGTALFMAQVNARAKPTRRLLLFDSFEGLSEPSARDGAFWHAGDLKASEQEVCRILSSFSNIEIYKGWIPSRFDEISDRRFCFVHIDVDIYQPTLDSIKFFYPRLLPCGMLVCDDYGFDTCPGARHAMDEYFANESEYIIHLPTGQGLVIKRPSG